MGEQLFQDELSYLRDVGREFVLQNPKLASYLGTASTDPDVERLLQGFAFLTARLRGRIDNEMSDFTHSVISLLYPNFLRPFPAATMIKFTPIKRSLTSRQTIPAGGQILSRQQGRISYPFTITNACTLYPLEVENAELERSRDSSKLRLTFATISQQPLKEINLDELRLTLTGNQIDKQTLYLWLGRYLKTITLVNGEGSRRRLDRERQLAPIGFSATETLLPQKSNGFEAWRLLQEYFAFPDKFYGYDLSGLAKFFVDDNNIEFDLEFDFSRPLPIDLTLEKTTIQLYCVPAINLFSHTAERLNRRDDQIFYPIVPSGQQTASMEIFSIDAVYSSLGQDTQEMGGVERDRRRDKNAHKIFYPPYESFVHHTHSDEEKQQLYWRLQHQRSLSSRFFDHHLHFVHYNNEPALPPSGLLIADLTCFNPDCADQLDIGDITISTDTMPSFVTYQNITKPSAVIYPPLDGAINWQLISNFAPNFISLLSRDSVGAILSIYNYAALYDRQLDRASRQRIDAISSFHTQPVDRLFAGHPVRGLKSCMTVSEKAFETEGELYLFTSLLAEFFSLYATINSFHELEAKVEESGTIYRWEPKYGRQPLI